MAQFCYYEGEVHVGAALKAALNSAGYAFVESPEQAIFIFTYFLKENEAEDCYFDSNGLVQKAPKGAYLIDLGPATPNFARELSAVASVSDLFFVEAPIAVKDTTLEDAFTVKENLACCVAAEAHDREVVVPVLRNFASQIDEFTEPGSAQLAHSAWALQHCASIFSAVEAEALYRAMKRIPTSAVLTCDGNTVPTLEQTQSALVAAIAQKRFSGTYTIEHLMANINAALSAADDAELILPQAEACLRLLELLAIIGGSDKSPAAISIVYDEEETAASFGLDWSRAESFTGSSRDEDALNDYNASGKDGNGGAGGADAMGGADDDDDFGGYADLFGNYSEN